MTREDRALRRTRTTPPPSPPGQAITARITEPAEGEMEYEAPTIKEVDPELIAAAVNLRDAEREVTYCTTALTEARVVLAAAQSRWQKAKE